MKNLGYISSYIANSYGLEPSLIVEINWGGELGTIKYGKKVLTGFSMKPDLVSIEDIKSSLTHTNIGQIQSTSVVLKDFDNLLRDQLELIGIENCPVSVYQAYEGITPGNELKIFQGYISGPIAWEEFKTQLSFDLVSIPKDIDLGVLLTDEYLETTAPFSTMKNLLESARDKFVPYVLGCIVNAPTLKITGQIPAVLFSRLTMNDPNLDSPEIEDSTTIDLRTNDLSDPIFKYFGAENVEYISINNNILQIEFDKYVDMEGEEDTSGNNILARYNIIDMNPYRYTQYIYIGERVKDDPDYDNPKVFWLRDDGIILRNNMVAVQYPIATFNLCSEQQGRKCFFEESWTEVYMYLSDTGNIKSRRPKKLDENYVIQRVSTFCPENGGADDDYFQYENLREAKTISYDKAQTVYVWERTTYGYQKEIYLVNTIKSNIRSVQAFFKEKQASAEIPYAASGNSHYRIVTNWHSLAFTALEFNCPISEYGEGWSDEIFVSQRSITGYADLDNSDTVWGSTPDLLRFLILENTDFTVHDASFDIVKTAIEDYPTGIALTSQPKLFDLLGDIAWQARCVLNLVNGVFYLKHISEVPEETLFLVDDDLVLQESFTMQIPETMDLTTHLAASFVPQYDWDQITRTYRQNTSYANTRKEKDFFAFHNEVCVAASAKFWLNRYANLWKRVSFALPLEGLALELYDIVTLDLSGVLGTFLNCAEAEVFAEVKAVSYSIDKKRVMVSVELPIVVGSDEIDNSYWQVQSITRPKNPCLKDLRQYYDILEIKKVEQHKFEQHKNINILRKRQSNGEMIGVSGALDGDILTYDAESQQWVLGEAGSSGGSGGAGLLTGTVLDLFCTEYLFLGQTAYMLAVISGSPSSVMFYFQNLDASFNVIETKTEEPELSQEYNGVKIYKSVIGYAPTAGGWLRIAVKIGDFWYPNNLLTSPVVAASRMIQIINNSYLGYNIILPTGALNPLP